MMSKRFNLEYDMEVKGDGLMCTVQDLNRLCGPQGNDQWLNDSNQHVYTAGVYVCIYNQQMVKSLLSLIGH